MNKHILVFMLIAAAGLVAPGANAQLSVGLSVQIAPPAIPVYEQPLCPVDGDIWIPGYWAYGDDGYYWVPGYWDTPPTVGYLWTPGYWGFVGGVYAWNAGYWGPHVGYYGGINYGYGYGGHGYYGGEWYGGHFRYNTAVTRVNTTVVHNTYINRTGINNSNSRVSFNGGPGGVSARPTSGEEAAMHERHVGVTSAQQQHQQAASRDRNQFANVNHGRPASLAVARPIGTGNHAAAANHAAGAGGRPGGAPAVNRPSTPNATAHVNHNTTNMNRPNTPNVNRPQPTMNRPQGNRPQPAMHTAPSQAHVQPHPQMNRPQMNHPQPQMHQQRPVMNHPQPQMAHTMPHQAPPHGGGGGGERHH